MKNHDIRYLRVILTTKCNLHCKGCHREGEGDTQNFVDFNFFCRAISNCIEAGIRKVKLMGGEPTLFPHTQQLILFLKGKYPFIDLSMISNGLADVAYYSDCFSKGLDRLNLSIHGWKASYFFSTAGATEEMYQKRQDTLQRLLAAGKISKINYVVKKGENEEDLFLLIDWLSKFSDIRLDILNFLTFYEDDPGSRFYYSFEEIQDMLDKRFGIYDSFVYPNPHSIDSCNLILKTGLNVNLKVNQLRDFHYMNICDSCPRKSMCIEGIAAMRLTSDFKLRPCLIRNDQYLDLSQADNDEKERIEEYFKHI